VGPFRGHASLASLLKTRRDAISREVEPPYSVLDALRADGGDVDEDVFDDACLPFGSSGCGPE
jgi:hypothetical protein